MTALTISVALALVFTYTNGFHDAANAIAVSIATRALRPAPALAIAAVGNLVGSFFGIKVATTVASGIIELPPGSGVLLVVSAALIGAIGWNLITWRFGLPSSSSHALIGGMVGAALPAGVVVLWSGVVDKVLIPMVISPVIGFLLGYAAMLVILWAGRRADPAKVRHGFRFAQRFSATALAVGHGMQDGAKTMGIIVLALDAAGKHSGHSIPLWVYLSCATTLSLGTASGGFRIMKTLGSRVTALDPVQGFAAEATGASVLYVAAIGFGAPVSTTHVISSAVMGVGASKRVSAVRWKVAVSMIQGWIYTFPGAGLLAAAAWGIGTLIT
jgi:PiT family inorganic phosphate transporter